MWNVVVDLVIVDVFGFVELDFNIYDLDVDFLVKVDFGVDVVMGVEL